MDELGKDIARRWFNRRFENRVHDPAYFSEWLDRFDTGHPYTYMDSQSLTIYMDIMQEYVDFKV